MTVVWRTECKEKPLLVKMLQTSKWCTCEKGSGQGDTFWYLVVLRPLPIRWIFQLWIKETTKSWIFISENEVLLQAFFFIVFSFCSWNLSISQIGNIFGAPMLFLLGRTGTNTPEQDHWIIESLRHPKHFNIFGVAEVAVCLVVPWKLNVTYMERVMRLKNSIVTYPSFQE